MYDEIISLFVGSGIAIICTLAGFGIGLFWRGLIASTDRRLSPREAAEYETLKQWKREYDEVLTSPFNTEPMPADYDIPTFLRRQAD